LSKDETKKTITQKDLKKWVWKKPLIRGIQIFSWRVKLNLKIALIKGKTNKKNKGQIEKKIKQQKVWLKVEKPKKL